MDITGGIKKFSGKELNMNILFINTFDIITWIADMIRVDKLKTTEIFYSNAIPPPQHSIIIFIPNVSNVLRYLK